MFQKLVSKIEFYRTIIQTLYYSHIKGYNIGKNSEIYCKSKIISDNSNVVIGSNCVIGRSRYRCHGGMPFYTTLFNEGSRSHISIGNGCRLNGVYVHAEDFVEIGNNCVIATGVSIIDSNGHQINSVNRTKGRDDAKGIKIGNNVWIGMNATILKGTVLDDNCVVGAGCVIQGTYPADSLIKQCSVKTETISFHA